MGNSASLRSGTVPERPGGKEGKTRELVDRNLHTMGSSRVKKKSRSVSDFEEMKMRMRMRENAAVTMTAVEPKTDVYECE